MAKSFGLGKKEKLKSRKQIDALFANGKSFAVFPLRVSYTFVPAETDAIAQIGVTASKRHFKKAVDRNRIKRLLREAYRLQKNDFTEVLKRNSTKASLFFMYTDKTMPTFAVVKTAMHHCLNRLKQKLGTVNEDIA
jgi:ribonuclease P protein component